MKLLVLAFALLLSLQVFACGQAVGPPGTPSIAKAVFRTPLSEVGQSGVCLSGDRLFLTVHKQLNGPMKDGFFYNGDIVGQCFDKHSGEQLWQVNLPGTHAGRVLESWNDATSLSPVASDKYVLFHNLNGMLGCYTHDGTLVWQRSWQAPDPDVKMCRMYLQGDSVIVSMPSKEIAVQASSEHPELPFYKLHCLGLSTGEERWVSPVLLHHATQYSLSQWQGSDVIVASMIDLSHWQFGQERSGFLISPDDGRILQEIQLPPAIPHQKNQICDGRFLVTSASGKKATLFQLIDPGTSAISREFRIDKPDRYYAWNGTRYGASDFEPLFSDSRTLRGKGQPTPSTVHVVGKRIYFWRYDTSAIGCVSIDTGRSTLLQVPIQVRADATAWVSSEFQFTNGIQNASGKKVNMRVDTVRGIQRGGFGHTNPAWPAEHNGKLYWINGAGLLYVIDTTQPLSPQAVHWTSIAPTGNAWTFGSPAVDNEALYIRTQRELIRVNHPL